MTCLTSRAVFSINTSLNPSMISGLPAVGIVSRFSVVQALYNF